MESSLLFDIKIHNVTNFKIIKVYYMTLTIHTAFKPGKCQSPAGLVLIHISTAFQWIFAVLP